AAAEVVAAATRSMAALNRIPAAAAQRHGVRAATDITGFGLLGHAWNVARESGLTLEIRTGDVPLLPGAEALALDNQAAGLKANRREYEGRVEEAAGIEETRRALVYDPQTSGGLLLLVPAESLDALLEDLPQARCIGRALPSAARPLRLL